MNCIGPEEPDFVSVGLDHVGCKFVMPLMAIREDVRILSGSAVLLNNQIAITARHVVDDFFLRFENRAIDKHEMATFNLIGLTIYDEEKFGSLWNVKKIFANSFTDCALLHIEPKSDHARIRRNVNLRINPVPPAPGTKVTALGYKNPIIDKSGGRDHVTIDPTVTTGTVLDLFLNDRPSKARDACFGVDFLTMPSMSGGPVFDETGCLCGIISSSFETAPGIPPYTFCSILAPILGLELDIDRKGHPSGINYRAIELASEGILSVANLDRIKTSGEIVEIIFPSTATFS